MTPSDTRALALAVLGIALMTGMDALIKVLSASYDSFQIVFLRFTTTALCIGATLAVTKSAPWPRRDRLRAHALRAGLMVVATSTFVYALGRLPLAEVFALSYTGPIFVALFGTLFLKERVRWPTAVAIASGFAGVLAIALGGPDAVATSGTPWLAIACAVVSPVTYALSIVLLRAQTVHEPVPAILLAQSLLVAGFVAPLAAPGFHMPQGSEWLAIAGLGLLGSTGYVAFASALAKINAAQVAAVEYTGLIWAALLGYLFFAEVPRATVWLGAALIVGGCTLMMLAKKPAA